MYMLLSSKFNKPSKISIKTSNTMEYIELDIQKLSDQYLMIRSFSIYKKTY